MAWENKKRPRIVLCIPHKNPFVSTEWDEVYNRLLLPPPFHVLRRRGPLPVDDARNELVEEALKEDPEWILFLDDDVIPPIDVAYMLMGQHLPIVSVLYPDKPGRSAAFRLVKGKPEPVPWGELERATAYVDAVGFGCVLVDSRVFKLAKEKGLYPWFRYEYHPVYNPEGLSEDQYFCIKVAGKLGIPILVNGYVIAKHVFVGAMHTDRKIGHLVV